VGLSFEFQHAKHHEQGKVVAMAVQDSLRQQHILLSMAQAALTPAPTDAFAAHSACSLRVSSVGTSVELSGLSSSLTRYMQE